MGTFIKEGVYCTAAEVARILDRNPKRITQLIQSGKLACVHVGPHALIPQQAVFERKSHIEEWQQHHTDKAHNRAGQETTDGS